MADGEHLKNEIVFSIDDLKKTLRNVEKFKKAAEEGADKLDNVNFESTGAARIEEAIQDASDAMENINEDAKVFGKLEAEIQAVKAEFAKVGSEIEEGSDEMKSLVNRANKLRSDAKQAANNTSELSANSGRAYQASMALGNVLADFPHGPSAAANNVGELIEGMFALRDEVSSVSAMFKAMLGPALFAGMITGVSELAANWDRVSNMVGDFVSRLKGAREETVKLNKAVRNLTEEGLGNIGEKGVMTPEELQKLRSELIERREKRESIISDRRTQKMVGLGDAMMQNQLRRARANQQSAPSFTSQHTRALKSATTAIKQQPLTIDEISKVLTDANFSESRAKEIAQGLISDDESGSGGEIDLADGPEMEYADDRVTLRGPEIIDPSKVSGKGPIPESVSRRRMDVLLQRRSMQRRSNTMATTSPRSFARRRQMEQNRFATTKERLDARIRRMREDRSDMRTGGASKGEIQKQTNKIQTALAKRRKVKKQHQQRLEKIETQHRQRRLQAFNRFTSNFQQIGGAMSSLFSTWRKERTRELKKEGKSQKEINETIREEGKKRFEFMKKLRIASSVANTISSGVLAFHQTMQLPLGGFQLPLAISNMAATLAAGYAKVRKLQSLRIGGGVGSAGGAGGAGGAAGARYKQLDGRIRNRRVENTAIESNRDMAQPSASRDLAKSVKKEQEKTRSAIREGMSIGDDAAFRSNEEGANYSSKATS